MRKIKITFPQIVFEQKEVEVTQEQYEDLIEHSSCSEKAKFIWSNMTDMEKQWTEGEKWVEGAVDCYLCGVYSIKNESND